MAAGGGNNGGGGGNGGVGGGGNGAGSSRIPSHVSPPQLASAYQTTTGSFSYAVSVSQEIFLPFFYLLRK